jgi:hypothetical protein
MFSLLEKLSFSTSRQVEYGGGGRAIGTRRMLATKFQLGHGHRSVSLGRACALPFSLAFRLVSPGPVAESSPSPRPNLSRRDRSPTMVMVLYSRVGVRAHDEGVSRRTRSRVLPLPERALSPRERLLRHTRDATGNGSPSRWCRGFDIHLDCRLLPTMHAVSRSTSTSKTCFAAPSMENTNKSHQIPTLTINPHSITK